MVHFITKHLGGNNLSDIFYIDYRIGRIAKNLDTTYMAPEFYNEVIVNPSMAGVYEYTYVDEEDNYLAFSFTQLELDQAHVPFETMLSNHFKRHNFDEDARLVRKLLFITQEEFDAAPKDFKD